MESNVEQGRKEVTEKVHRSKCTIRLPLPLLMQCRLTLNIGTACDWPNMGNLLRDKSAPETHFCCGIPEVCVRPISPLFVIPYDCSGMRVIVSCL